jgi:hypothetical protein
VGGGGGGEGAHQPAGLGGGAGEGEVEEAVDHLVQLLPLPREAPRHHPGTLPRGAGVNPLRIPRIPRGAGSNRAPVGRIGRRRG